MARRRVDEVTVGIGADTKRFSQGIEQANQKLSLFARKLTPITTGVLGIGLSIGGVVAAMNDLANELDSIGKRAHLLGVTAEELQKIQIMADHAGLSSEKLTASMRFLVRTIGDIQNGNTAALKTFNQLGISFDEIKAKSPYEQLLSVLSALSKIENTNKRNALAAKLFAAEGQSMVNMAKDLEQALKAVNEQQEKGYIATNEQVKQAEAFNDAWTDFTNAAKSRFIPTLVKMMEVGTAMLSNDFTKLYEKNISFYRELSAEERKANKVKFETKKRLKEIAEQMQRNIELAKTYQEASKTVDDVQKKALLKIREDLLKENKRLQEEKDRLLGTKKEQKPTEPTSREPSAETKQLLNKYKPELSQLEQYRQDRLRIIEAYNNKEIDLEQKRIALQELARQRQAYLDEQDLQRARQRAKELESFARVIEEMDQEEQQAFEQRAYDSQRLFDQYASPEMKKKADIEGLEQDLKRLSDLFNSGDLKVSTQEYLAMVDQINQRIVELNSTASEFGRIMEKNAESIGIAFGRSLAGMKVNWEALAAQIIADLVQMALLAQFKDTPFAFLAPLLGGTIRGLGQANSQPTTTVNIENRSSVPQTFRTEDRFDGKEYVTTIIIEDLNNNGPIAQIIGR